MYSYITTHVESQNRVKERKSTVRAQDMTILAYKLFVNSYDNTNSFMHIVFSKQEIIPGPLLIRSQSEVIKCVKWHSNKN